ncbi:lytic transglycosylase domain-containing protein [Escherichia coli]|nr:lytic transglycosylase domain-containing protein [Escherichia coli]
MAQVLDELVLSLGIDDRDFTAGEQAVHAALNRLTTVMEGVADTFSQGQKKTSESLEKTGKDADKTARRMEDAGKRASRFFSGIRSEILALAGVSLTLGGLKNLVTGFARDLNRLSVESDAFGMKARNLDGWLRAARANNVDEGEMSGAFSRLANAKAAFRAGRSFDPVLQDLFQVAARAGISVDLNTDSTEAIMRKLAVIFPRLTKSEQTAYGNALGFSYAGQQFLGSGHALKDVDEFTSRSQVTPGRIALARKLRKELVELDQTWSGIGMTISTALMPYALKLSHWLETLGDWMQQHPEEVNRFITTFLNDVESVASLANKAAGELGGWQNVIITLIGLKVASWVRGLTKALSGPGGLLFAITALYPVVDGLLTSIVGRENKDWLDSHGFFWASDGTFFFNKKEMETYQTKLDAGEKPGNITRAQSPTVWQQGMLDTQASQATGREAAFGESWLQGMRATQEKLGNAMQNRQRPTRTGEALLGWLQPKLSQLEEKYNLPPGLLRSVAITESRGNQFAVSPAGAMGLFQFMPKTASEFGLRGNDAFDPEKAADAAARKLGGLIRFFHGDLAKALAAYNWGEGNVQRKGLAAAPEETRNYIPRVLANLPYPGAAMAIRSRHPAPVSQSTVTETTHIGTLNVTTTSDNVKGITDDARRRITNSALVSVYSSGVTG